MQTYTLDELEGIKFSKFLKRATGSRRMTEALLKTAVTGAAVGAVGYGLNRRYGWWNKAKRILPRRSSPKPPPPSFSVVKAPKPSFNQKNERKESFLNTEFLKSVVNTFLTNKNQNTQTVQTQANVGSQINPMLIAAIAAVGIGALILMRKK